MSSRSMNYLRKNAKFILVVMGIVCMITFVVGTALVDLAASARRGLDSQTQNPVVVTWTKGTVRDTELRNLRFRHQLAYTFLYRLIAEAAERGGKPMVNGRPITREDLSRGQVDVGIPQDSSDESLVQTMVLAEEGRRMGVVVDQEAVKDYLRQISYPELKEGDWLDIARELVTDKNITVNQLFEHLQYELKAHHVRMLAMAGLYAQGVGPIVPPGEAFELFSRLNRRLAIEAYPVEVKPLVAEVKGEPSQAELEKIFEEGKYRDPNPNSDEPGFHKPHKLAFTYLKVNFAPFLEEAKKQITEEQIEEAYKKDISQGLHKVLELPPEEKKESESSEKKEGEAAEKKEGDKPAEKDKDQTPADAKPASDKPGPEKPAEKSADNKSGCDDNDEPPAGKTDAASQQPPATAAEKPSDKPATDEKPAEGQAKPAESAPAKEPKFKPLSEVHDEIQTRLAQPIAEEARKNAVGELTGGIEKYGKAYRRYLDVKNVRKGGDVQEPAKLDLAAVAAKYDFPISTTPLVDQFEISDYEIGQKVQQFDMAFAQTFRQFRFQSFAEIAFGQDQPLFKPDEVRSSEPDISYIYFRTAEEKAADVTLKDVRPQVVEFWKKQKAFELAMIDAEKLAGKAKGSTSLAEVVPDAKKVVVTPPFSWMSPGGFGFGQPELSQVPGIELAGREFMQAVFALKSGDTGAAPNEAHSKVFVVHIVSQDPDDERLRQQFLESGYNQLVLMLAQREALSTSVEWYRGVAQRYQVKWQRPPQDERRM